MANKYPNEDYLNRNVSELYDIWESRKEYIEKDLWVIRNFLSEEEIAINPFALLSVTKLFI